MRILVAIEDLRTGGAQTFALRLAQALHQAGHEVLLHCHYHYHINQDLVRQLAPDVPVVAHGQALPLLDWVLRKFDGALLRLGTRFSWREQWTIRHLRRTARRFRPEVVNSHTIKSDYVAAKALAGDAPLVITMHGCYELFLHKADAPEVTPKGQYALQHAAAVVYLTDKNQEIFSQAPWLGRFTKPLVKIYNGFNGHFSALKADHTRAALGIPDDAVVFGMVARGIPEKGWEEAIQSFLALSEQHPNAHLVLVGESEFLTQLRQRYVHPRIHFTGFSRNPVDWIDLFTVGLLPSYFHAESLPNSVAEYLACSKPVIASTVGEVPAMLATEQGLAGQLLELDQRNWRLVSPEQLTTAMQAYLQDAELLAEHTRRAAVAFDKFRMERCVAAYLQLFTQVQA